MKYLGIDHGTSTCGLSIGVAGVALPLCSISTYDIWEALTEIVLKEKIKYIIVGVATLLDGTRTKQTQIQESFVRKGQQKFPETEWMLFDENLTSLEAEESKLQGAEHTKDAIAASIILQSYFDSYSRKCI